MTPIGQWKRLDRVMVECTVHMFITHCPNVTLQLHNFDFFRTCRIQVVSALLRGSWQDFNWHDSSRGPSAIAELLVTFDQPPYISSKWATVHLTLAVFMYSGVLKEGHWVMPPTEVQYFKKKLNQAFSPLAAYTAIGPYITWFMSLRQYCLRMGLIYLVLYYFIIMTYALSRNDARLLSRGCNLTWQVDWNLFPSSWMFQA